MVFKIANAPKIPCFKKAYARDWYTKKRQGERPWVNATVKIDSKDKWLLKLKWRASADGYARKCVTGHIFLLHKLILEPPEGMVVDHINGDTLDNRLKNLRIVTPRQNAVNRKNQSNNKSGYAGVCFEKRRDMWKASIYCFMREITVGYFKNKSDAIKARKEAEKEYYGKYARKEKYR